MTNDALWTAIDEAAEAAGIPYNTRAQWRSRGFVPPSGHFNIVKASKGLVTHEELHKMWKRAKKGRGLL